METRTKRTLVKSAPELWEMVDDPELMRRWCSAIAPVSPAEAAVTVRDPGRRLTWGGSGAEVDLWLHGKGFGTNVTIIVRAEREVGGDILESLLDELASPQRRPFARG